MGARRIPPARILLIALLASGAVGFAVFQIRTSNLSNEVDQDRDALQKLGVRMKTSDFGRVISLELNAAPDYMRAHELATVKEVRRVEIRFDKDGHETAESKERIQQWVAANAALLRIAAHAATKPECSFSRNWALGQTLSFEEYPSMRLLVQLVSSKARTEADRGNIDAALQWITVALTIADHLAKEPGLASLIVARSCELHALSALQRIIMVHGSDSAFNRKVTQLVLSAKPIPSVKRVLDWEIATKQQAILDLSTGVNTAEGLWGSSTRRQPLSRFFWIPYVRLQVEKLMLSRYRKFFELNQTADTRDLWLALQKLDRDFITDRSTYGRLARKFVPPHDLAGALPLEMEARRRMTLLGLWIKSEQGKKGKVPAQLPKEPFAIDPFSEQPFRYHPDGASFVLYSVGPDLRDDKGIAQSTTPGRRPMDDIEFDYGYRRVTGLE